MIDYKQLRETAKKIVGVSWVTSKPCHFHEFMELLDKAEKWDKVNEGLPVDGLHTSPGLLKELFDLREKVENESAPSDENKQRLKKIFDNMVRKSRTNNGHWLSDKDFDFMYTNLKKEWGMEDEK